MRTYQIEIGSIQGLKVSAEYHDHAAEMVIKELKKFGLEFEAPIFYTHMIQLICKNNPDLQITLKEE